MSADLISRFGRPITVKSRAVGSYVDGYFVAGAETTQSIIASVQRLTAKEIALLKEGSQQKEMFKLYSIYQFKAQNETTMEASDYVVIDGREFMVLSVEDFVVNQAMNLKYYRANVVSTNPNPS